MKDYADKTWLKPAPVVPPNWLLHPENSPKPKEHIDWLYEQRARMVWQLARMRG